MPGLLARIGVYVIAAGIVFDTILDYLGYFGDFENHFPFGGLFSPFLLPIGLVLILASGFVRLSVKFDARSRISLTGSKTAGFEVVDTPGSGTRPRRWPLSPRFSSIPSRGLMSFSLAVPLIFVMFVVGYSPPQRGIWVFSVPVLRNVKLEPWDGALVLRIDVKKRLYLNSKRIPSEELTQALTYGLARRAARIVYVDGDQDLEYRDVIAVMDAIRGVHAKVILLTRETSDHPR